MRTLHSQRFLFWFVALVSFSRAYAQLTPSNDSYINSASPATNYGAKTMLDVQSGGVQTTFILFDLSSIPVTYTGSNIARATLKLYVNGVTTAGTFNVDYVNGLWNERSIDGSNAPALGTTIAASVPLTSLNVHDYVLVDVTPAMVAWLNGAQPNYGLALVGNSALNANFDSKESTTTSQPPTLDIVFASGGTITGVTTANGSGLTGGGTTGTLSLSLNDTCGTNQVLQWNGTSWACATAGTGTITGVTAGSGLSGGGTSGNVNLAVPNGGITNSMLTNPSLTVTAGPGLNGGGPVALGGSTTLNVDTTRIAQLNAPNTFTANQSITGNELVNGTISGSFGSFGGNSGGPDFGITNNGSGDGLDVLSNGAYGIVTQSLSTADFSAGVLGASYIGSGKTIGVSGFNQSASGAGVYGVEVVQSVVGHGYAGGAGVWGDGGKLNHTGVLATADGGVGVIANNNSTSNPALFAWNTTSTQGTPVLQASGNFGYCIISVNGNLNCSGSKSAVVSVDGGSRQVALYAVEAPENWFEDAGSGRLSAGSATILLDPTFAQTVNGSIEYHVFLTPKADCDGLYVDHETPGGFEVHELHGGRSSVAFSYRVMAHRKGYESIRLADMTNSVKAPSVEPGSSGPPAPAPSRSNAQSQE